MSQSFERVGPLAQGYHVEQVDSFFFRARAAYESNRLGTSMTAKDVRSAGFDLVRGGYEVGAVDAALDRMEDAFGTRERERRSAQLGEDGVLAELARRASTLAGRLARPDGERFERGTGIRPSYATADVDDLCHRLRGYFDEGEEMSIDEVRRAVFRRRRGSRGYREAQVDAFLERVVEVMLAAG